MFFEPENEWLSQEQIGQRYAAWCMAMLEVHGQARRGFDAFVCENQMQRFDCQPYRQKAWIPSEELHQYRIEQGITIQKARQLRTEYRTWIEAIRWSDPERIHRRLARKALRQSMN
ncbi:MAG: hypothetical protein U0Y10_24810 [Spirosomataceae bacterium]